MLTHINKHEYRQNLSICVHTKHTDADQYRPLHTWWQKMRIHTHTCTMCHMNTDKYLSICREHTIYRIHSNTYQHIPILAMHTKTIHTNTYHNTNYNTIHSNSYHEIQYWPILTHNFTDGSWLLCLLFWLRAENQLGSQSVAPQHRAVDCNVLASCRDSLIAGWMKAMTWTPPVATYLHTMLPPGPPVATYLHTIDIPRGKSFALT